MVEKHGHSQKSIRERRMILIYFNCILFVEFILCFFPLAHATFLNFNHCVQKGEGLQENMKKMGAVFFPSHI